MPRLQGAPRGTLGRLRDPSCPDVLYVATGLPDDPRKPVDQSHRLYGRACHAWGCQADWTPDVHHVFWTALLPEWPRPRSTRPTKDRVAALAERLRTLAYLTDREIGELICVAPDTVRRTAFVAWGHTLELESCGRGVGLGTDKEFLSNVAPPLPRVLAMNEEPPLYALGSVEDSSLDDPDWLTEASAKGAEYIAAMWQSGELRRAGGLDVRLIDGEPNTKDAFEAWRRLIAQAGFSESEVEEILADAQARGKLPNESHQAVRDWLTTAAVGRAA